MTNKRKTTKGTKPSTRRETPQEVADRLNMPFTPAKTTMAREAKRRPLSTREHTDLLHQQRPLGTRPDFGDDRTPPLDAKNRPLTETAKRVVAEQGTPTDKDLIIPRDCIFHLGDRKYVRFKLFHAGGTRIQIDVPYEVGKDIDVLKVSAVRTQKQGGL